MRRVIAGFGRLLIATGVLILLFVAYQLWGTGIYTARAQDRLKSEFSRAFGSTPPTRPPSTTSPTAPTTTTTNPPPPAPPEGSAAAHLVIPKIGVDYYVVEGVTQSDLRDGPGHYPDTPLPGQLGNSAIAGHRTTYGAPFGDLDLLEPGDRIEITTRQGTFDYRVYERRIVAPDQIEVLEPDPTRPATVTLTTCNPKYSAAERLVVKGELVLPTGSTPLPASVAGGSSPAKLGEAGLSGTDSSKLPTVLWGLGAALAGLLWWWFFHRHPRWTTWSIGAVPFAVVLFFFYFNLERVLPANY